MSSLASNLLRPGRMGKRSFFPSRLFAAGEKGLFYDFGDQASLFQDNAGATPAAADQVVGRILDKSGNNNHATQATAAAKPLWRSGGYLEFDGVDDGLATAAIDFTSTDKISVVLGIRDNNTTAAVIAEISADSNLNNGAFYIAARNGASNGTCSIALRGTTSENISASSGNTIPFPVVLTGLFDIAGAAAANEMIMRVNGLIPATTLNGGPNAGTGNFGNWLFSLGRRSAGTFPFKDRIYSVLVIGRILSATEIAAMESWMAPRAGVILP
jgi:hypothetical protein